MLGGLILCRGPYQQVRVIVTNLSVPDNEVPGWRLVVALGYSGHSAYSGYLQWLQWPAAAS